jgi:hypothetical protein
VHSPLTVHPLHLVHIDAWDIITLIGGNPEFRLDLYVGRKIFRWRSSTGVDNDDYMAVRNIGILKPLAAPGPSL